MLGYSYYNCCINDMFTRCSKQTIISVCSGLWEENNNMKKNDADVNRQLEESCYTIADLANSITSSTRVEEVEYKWEMGVRDAFANVCNKLIDRLKADSDQETANAVQSYLSNWDGKYSWYKNGKSLSLFMEQTAAIDKLVTALSKEHGHTDDELVIIANSFTGLRQILYGYDLFCI